MQLDKLVYAMLTESTGIHMMDSGGGEGRGWQRNQKLTLADFQKAPSVEIDVPDDAKTSKEIEYTISVFHWLLLQPIELDTLCEEFNALECKDWESDIYGVSKEQAQWLEDHRLYAGDSWNTYNGQSSLSQVLQGTNLHTEENQSNFEYPDYVLIQIHNGADVRGGYTDAKLFKCNDYFGREDVMGTITKPDGETLEIDNTYDGYSLTNDNGAGYDIDPKSDKVELYISGE